MFEVSAHSQSSAAPAKLNEGEFDSSGFGFQLLKKAGAGAVVEGLLAGDPISAEQFRILSRIDFPLLAKIVEIVGSGSRAVQDSRTVRVRPVVFLPLADSVEQSSLDTAVNAGMKQIRDIDQSISWDGRIAIAIDRWHGRFELAVLVSALEQILSGPFRNSFCVLGPSTADLAEIAADDAALKSAFLMVERLGIDTIEGGDDFSIHRSAAAAGFISVIGQDIGITERKRSKAGTTADNSEFFDQLYLHLAAVIEFGESGGNIDTWFPRLPAGFDRGPSDGDLNTEPSILGLDLCRVFMLARLMLPAVPYIRAPLAKVGPRLAAVSISLAANDLGFAAFDPVTAQALGVLEISKIEDIIPEQHVFSRIL